MAAAAASGHGKLLRGEPLAELEKTRPLSQEKFDEQYPANLLDELKGFDLVKYRAEREKVLRESHIKAIAFNEVLERYSSEAVLAVTAALKECPGLLDRLREKCPLMRPAVAEDGTVSHALKRNKPSLKRKRKKGMRRPARETPRLCKPQRGAAIAEAVPKHNSKPRSGPGGLGGSLPDRRCTGLGTRR